MDIIPGKDVLRVRAEHRVADDLQLPDDHATMTNP
jgi:hypothetical protein